MRRESVGINVRSTREFTPILTRSIFPPRNLDELFDIPDFFRLRTMSRYATELYRNAAYHGERGLDVSGVLSVVP